tara:strand:+ start:225 stop:1412 length:1188 start_codon:yes stop_codon:yes gene_type:complete
MQIFKSHSLLVIYHFIFAVLIYGLLRTSGTLNIDKISIFYICFILTYFISYHLLKNKITFKLISINLNKQIEVLPIISISLIFFHLLYLGKFHAISAIKLNTITEVIQLRRSITAESNYLINYMASFNIKGLLPFSLLALLITKKSKLYWILFLLGSFYAFCLMQKSFIIVILAPVFIYSLLNKKWVFLSKYTSFISIIIISLVLIQNPQIRNPEVSNQEILEDKIKDSTEESSGTFKKVLNGLEKRILIIPGQTIAGWFEHIPENLPYQNGSGYRFVKYLTKKEHSNYAKELYPLMYPSYAAKGLQGNVNVASFMYDYANFGWKGFIISGLSIGLLFVFIELLFKDRLILKLSINTIPVFLLSSQAITTALFSGGWGLMLILYFLFRKKENFNK